MKNITVFSLLIFSLFIKTFSQNTGNDFVKQKTFFVPLQEDNLSIPIAYGNDDNTIFGATYKIEKKDNGVVLSEKPQLFSMIFEGNKWSEKYYQNKKELEEVKTTSKFIVSIVEDGVSNLYIVEFKDGKFTEPESLGSPINSEYNELSGTFSPDGNKIYFSSNRKGGIGGYDIYESEYIGKGKWSHPRNLGSEINTEYDEKSPYLLRDGITLYFSANGYNANKSFDIYETILEYGFWTEPYKLEAPINTDHDDLYFNISPSEIKAVYSSFGPEGYGLYELTFY